MTTSSGFSQKQQEDQWPFIITTEFGPLNYLPTLPYTQISVVDQWKANVFNIKAIKKRMNIE